MNWMPIETAPKDAKNILCVDADGILAIVHDDLGAWCDDYGFYVEPTHWMPLPEPPKGEPK